jgi:hypothetical protein
MGKSFEALDNKGQAIDHYQKAIDHVQSPDKTDEPWLPEARAALVRLKKE